jgi:hypothetical protein
MGVNKRGTVMSGVVLVPRAGALARVLGALSVGCAGQRRLARVLGALLVGCAGQQQAVAPMQPEKAT